MLPPRQLGDHRALHLAWLDYYRDTVVRKLDGLDDTELRTSRLPSGWSPLELLKHLVFMERRWVRWGFTAEPVEEPWGDADADDRWRLASGDTLASLVEQLFAGGRRTREIVEAAELDARAATGGRFATEDEAPTLGWILFHVLQEYARHVGQLDVARELADGRTGE